MPNTHEVLFRTLADPTRRAIFERLCREGEQSVGALTARAGVSQPAVSKHLGVLKQAGLVINQAVGTRRIYRINSDGVRAIHAYLDQMWSQALAGFQLAAQQIADTESQEEA